MQFTAEQQAEINRLWNAGEAPNAIAAKIGHGADDQAIRDYLRTQDLERATRPASPAGGSGA